MRDHRLLLTSDYGINIIDNKASLSVAEKAVMRDVISRNTKEVSYRIRKGKERGKKKNANRAQPPRDSDRNAF